MSKELNMAEGQALLDKLAMEDPAALIRAIAGEGPKSNGGPAFPLEGSSKRNANSGMSLRDYFAAKFAAAQSVMTSADRDFIKPDYNYPEGLTVAERIAQTSYQLADAMLAERVK